MKGTEKKEDESTSDLFRFQCIASGAYECLDGIAENHPEDGLTITIAKAYFRGLVDGKREERKRNQNRLKRIGI